MSNEMGCKENFYTNKNTEQRIRQLVKSKKYRFRVEYNTLVNWNDFIALKEIAGINDLFVVISARHTSISYHPSFNKLPAILSKDFSHTNLLIIYPEQFTYHQETVFFSDPQAIDIQKNYRDYFDIKSFMERFKGDKS